MSEKLKRKSDWNGRYVMLKFDIETNGGAIFKAGDIMLVERNHGGLHLMATRNCKECGQQHRLRIIKVAERDVDLLPSGYVPENRPSRNEFLRAELAAAQAEVERLREMETQADVEHEIWSSWMRYMFTCGTINDDGTWTMPKGKVEHWQRQMKTPYSELTEREKDSDREQVRKHWVASTEGGEK